MADDRTQDNAPGEVSFPRTLDQHRAEFAWRKVSAISPGNFKEYRSLVRGFPAMVQQNGLGQAVAFLLANSNSAKKELLSQLEEWLVKKGGSPVPPIYGTGTGSLMDRLITADSRTLRRATGEVQALCIWLKRFTEGIAIEEASGNATPTLTQTTEETHEA